MNKELVTLSENSLQLATNLALSIDTPKDIKEAFLCKSPRLSRIRPEVCDTYIAQVLVKYISRYWNTENTLTLTQAVVAAELIRETYPGLKVSEIKMILKMAAIGLLGRDSRIYGQIDPAKIMDMIREVLRNEP